MRIDWNDLDAAFSFAGSGNQYFLLFQTGEVIFLSEDMDEEERVEIEARLDASGSAAIEPPDSHEQWGWMAAFSETVPDQHLRELLQVAIEGKGGFRRFKDVLLRAPEERARWFRFEAQAMHEAIDRWVAGLAIKVENQPPWAERQTSAIGPDATSHASGDTSCA